VAAAAAWAGSPWRQCMADSKFSCWSGVSRLVGTNRRSTNGSSFDVGSEERLWADNDLPWQRGGAYGSRRSVAIPLDGQPSRLLELLPESPGSGQKLRDFWATFTALDLRALQSSRKWSQDDKRDLEKARERCLVATYPFALALQLLLESWPLTAGASELPARDRKGRDAAKASQLSEQWNILLAVQRILGRLDAPAPSLQDLAREIPERRERYLLQVRSFQLVTATLLAQEAARRRGGVRSEVAQVCTDELRVLLAVQHMVPGEWRWR